MTVKEISKLCGVTQRTVTRWIGEYNKKTNNSIKLKRGFENDIDLENTIGVIRMGTSDVIADLLLQNAKENEVINNFEDKF